MLRSVFLAVLLSFSPAPAPAAELARITVKIERVTPRGGMIKAALYNRASYAGHNGDATQNLLVEAAPGETVIVFKDIPPGQYAIKTMQDEDNNGKMDFNWFGMPKEPYGFSNDAKPGFDQPDFDKAAFTVQPGMNTIVIHLRNI